MQIGLGLLNSWDWHLQSRYGHHTPSLFPGYCPNHLLLPLVSPINKWIQTLTRTVCPNTTHCKPFSLLMFLSDWKANEIQECSSWILSLARVLLEVPLPYPRLRMLPIGLQNFELFCAAQLKIFSVNIIGVSYSAPCRSVWDLSPNTLSEIASCASCASIQ